MVHILVETHVSADVARGLTIAEATGELLAMSLLMLVAHRMAITAARIDGRRTPPSAPGATLEVDRAGLAVRPE